MEGSQIFLDSATLWSVFDKIFESLQRGQDGPQENDQNIDETEAQPITAQLM